jgi:hypothetical protein
MNLSKNPYIDLGLLKLLDLSNFLLGSTLDMDLAGISSC